MTTRDQSDQPGARVASATPGRTPSESPHTEHPHLDSGACLDGSGRMWTVDDAYSFVQLTNSDGSRLVCDGCRFCRQRRGLEIFELIVSILLMLALGFFIAGLVFEWWLA